MKRRSALGLLLVGGVCGRLPSQNVVDPGAVGPVLPPERVSGGHVRQVLEMSAPQGPWPAAATTVLEELLAHPLWRPHHLTLGISGHERHFTHPGETFWILSMLPPGHAMEEQVRAWLWRHLEDHSPAAAAGYVLRKGVPRELHEFPQHLIPEGRAEAQDAFGLYACWRFLERFGGGDPAAAAGLVEEVRRRVQPLLEEESPRELQDADAQERLNGDIAGLIGAWHLMDGRDLRGAIEDRLRELLELRINLERTDAWVWQPTRDATRRLHHGKLGRYLRLTPELGWALRQWGGGAPQARLRELRRRFPTWWIARGERLIGGENFTTSLNFSRALWQGWLLIDSPGPVERVPRWWLDVPWCRADLAWLEKAAVLGSAAAGRGR